MDAIMKFWDENPKTVSFVLGVVLTLLLVLIIYSLSGEYFQGQPSWMDEMAILHGAVELQNPAVQATKITGRSLEHMQDRAPGQSAITGRSDPRFLYFTNAPDNDDKATELLQSRGGAYRAIADGQRSRYMGLAKLGGADYEGYNWDGRPSNDENGLLHTQVWGINENRDF
jgi:hypothetical protein